MSTPTRPHKITILGAGNIGSKLWETLCYDRAADLIEVWNHSAKRHDNTQFIAQQLKVDQGIKATLRRHPSPPTSHYKFSYNLPESLKDAEIVVITAGEARKAGMNDRALLTKGNTKIIDDIAKVVKDNRNPNTIYIIATNPVDALTERFRQITGIPAERIIGLGGELDRTRLLQSICLQLGIGEDQIFNAEVVGQHGPTMVPLLDNVEVMYGGKRQKLTEVFAQLDKKQKQGENVGVWPADKPEYAELTVKQRIVNATKQGGDIMTELDGVSDAHAPAIALREMVHQVIDAKTGKKPTPFFCSALRKDAGVYTGGPGQFVMENGRCVHATLPLPQMSEQEKTDFDASVAACNKALTGLPAFEARPGAYL